jgi:hypothetical protein
VPGFPIRTPSDLSSVDSSPRLIAASYVLHRLLMPRHPPCALNNLTTKMLASTVQFSNNHPSTTAVRSTSQTLTSACGMTPNSAGKPRASPPHHPTNVGLRVFSQDPTVRPTPPPTPHSRSTSPKAQYLPCETPDSGVHLLVVPLRRATNHHFIRAVRCLCSLERR